MLNELEVSLNSTHKFTQLKGIKIQLSLKFKSTLNSILGKNKFRGRTTFLFGQVCEVCM